MGVYWKGRRRTRIGCADVACMMSTAPIAEAHESAKATINENSVSLAIDSSIELAQVDPLDSASFASKPWYGLRIATILAVVASSAVGTCLAAAYGQVLSIGVDGAVTVYDGPAVYTDEGATPIRPPRSSQRPAAFSHPIASLQVPPALERRMLQHAADASEISPALLAAVAWRESGRRAGRVSSAGAVGEMQLMPATARALHVDAADPGQNLTGGAAYLRRMMQRYDGDLLRALAAYNAGPGAVDRHHGPPPYKETQAYVAAVLDRLSQAVVPLSPAR